MPDELVLQGNFVSRYLQGHLSAHFGTFLFSALQLAPTFSTALPFTRTEISSQTLWKIFMLEPTLYWLDFYVISCMPAAPFRGQKSDIVGQCRGLWHFFSFTFLKHKFTVRGTIEWLT